MTVKCEAVEPVAVFISDRRSSHLLTAGLEKDSATFRGIPAAEDSLQDVEPRGGQRR